MRRLPGLSAIAALPILLAAGCGGHHASTAPDAGLESPALGVAPAFDEASAALDHAAGGFFPLQIGNRWQYLRRVEITQVPSDPAGSPISYVDEVDLAGELLCRETRDAREYVVERRTVGDPNGRLYYWLRHRQDRTGLYEWDGDLAEPSCKDLGAPLAAASPWREPELGDWAEAARRLGVPASSSAWRSAWESAETRRLAATSLARAFAPRRPGGGASGEIRRLRYPLFAGQSWVIRDDPSFTARVEGSVLLRTPAGRFRAWSIRIRGELFGPRDVVRVWYGRAGYLGLEARTFGQITDPSGDPIATVEAHETETLTGISLVGRGPLAAEPLGAPTAGVPD